MPTIAIFFGIIVQMYWRDHNLPHIHAWYQGQEALVAIETGEVIAGSLPKPAARLMREWVLLRQSELMENWEHGRQQEPFEQVPGADQQ